MNTENNNKNLVDACDLISGDALPAELVGIAGRLDFLAANHRAELGDAALVAMARATRPSAGGAARDGMRAGTPLRLAGEPMAVDTAHGARVWSSRGRLIGGLLAMAASVALVVALWPSAGGVVPGSSLTAATGSVDAAMQIAFNVYDKLSLDEFDALLAEADAIGNLSFEPEGKNAS